MKINPYIKYIFCFLLLSLITSEIALDMSMKFCEEDQVEVELTEKEKKGEGEEESEEKKLTETDLFISVEEEHKTVKGKLIADEQHLDTKFMNQVPTPPPELS